MEENAKQVAEIMKLLSNEHRLLILCALIQRPMAVGDIHEFTPHISLPALSQHLAHLKTAGIVESERRGVNVVYHMSDDRVAELMAFLKERFCS